MKTLARDSDKTKDKGVTDMLKSFNKNALKNLIFPNNTRSAFRFLKKQKKKLINTEAQKNWVEISRKFEPITVASKTKL